MTDVVFCLQALAQEINAFRKLAAAEKKKADAKLTAERKKKRLEILAMNKKYEAKMAETFKRQDEEMKKRVAEFKAHAAADAKVQAAHAEKTMKSLQKALSGEHVKAFKEDILSKRRGEGVDVGEEEGGAAGDDNVEA